MRKASVFFGIVLTLVGMLCSPAVMSSDSVVIDVGELEAGKEVTVRFRAIVANDLPASESSVNRDVTVSGEDDGSTPFDDVTATTSVPVARVLTQTSIDDLRQGGSSVGHIQLGESVSVHVSVDSDPSGGPVPEGESVTVSGAGASDCVATLDANGEGSCELTPANGGDQDIHAGFAQTSEFEASTATPVSLLVNRPPAFASTPVTEIGEGLPYGYTATATDADGHSLSFNAVTLPAWLGLTDNGDNTATLSGTPGLADVGDHDVVIEADDGFGGLTQHGFTVTVTENTLPEITSDPVTDVGVLQSYGYTITAVDADDDFITLSVDNQPAWLSFSQTVDDPGYAEAVLSGTPDTTDEGSYAIDVIANDGRGADVVDSFTLQVHPNSPPVFDSSPIVQGGEGLAYEYEVIVSDPDGDEITLSKDPTGQPWLDFEQTVSEPGEARGVLTGSPEMGDAGNYSIVLNAEDERGEITIQSFTLEIEANHPPDFTSTPVTDAYEGIVYSYTVEAEDIDGDELSFSMSTGPAWLSLSAASASTTQLSGEPGSADVGDHDVTLEVSDGRGGVATQNFIVTVQANEPPIITSTPSITADEAVPYGYSVAASDPDGDPIELSAPTLPAWLSFVDHGDGSGELTGTPGSDEAGDHDVVLQAEDDRGGLAEQAFTITVEANQAPVFNSTPVTEVREADDYVYAVAASDPDGDPIELSATTLPGWLSFVDHGDGTGELSGTPGSDEAGDHDVVLQAEDDRGGLTEQAFTITVEANQAPVFDSTPVTEVREGDDYVYAVAASDPDGDPIDLSAITLPAWLSFVDHGDGSGELTGTPGSDEAGDHDVVLQAEDDRGEVSEQVFAITVQDNQPPEFVSVPVAEVREGDEYLYEIEVVDPEDDPVTIEARELPDWLTLSDLGQGAGELTGTPGSDDAGAHRVILEAADDRDASVEQEFFIEVEANQPPVFVSEPVTDVRVGDELEYAVVATDPENDPIELSAPTLPDWLEFTDHGDGAGELSGQPDDDQVGDHDVVLRAEDDRGGGTDQAFTITVSGAEPPEFISEPVTEVIVDSDYLYEIVVEDPLESDITLAASDLPAWLSLADHGDGAGELRGQPGEDDIGDHDVVLVAENEHGLTAQQAFSISVSAAPEPVVEFSQAQLSFDQFDGSEVDSVLLMVTNTGEADLEFHFITEPDRPFMLLDGSCLEGTVLSPGESCEIEIGFAPDSPGTYSGNLEIATNAPDSPHDIELSGTWFEEAHPVPLAGWRGLLLLISLMLLAAARLFAQSGRRDRSAPLTLD